MAFSKSQRHDVRLLALFRGASYLGDTIALIALFLRLAPLGHAWAVAALAIAGSLPLVALAPLAGHIIDHHPAKRLLVVTGLFEALVCVGIGLWHGVVVTLVLMFALSSLVAFSMPGYAALVPTLAGEENIERSQGLVQSAQGIAGVAGPALGGLLVGWSGQSWPLYIDAASFAIAALATTLLHHDRRPSPRSGIEALESRRLLAGAGFVWHDKVLRPIVVAVMVFMLSLGMVNVAEVFFATSTLHA
ncbi:MAG: MFS transporter, partial [Acidimicrobiales bacterium]